MVRTGVFLKDKEKLAYIKKAAKEAQETPVISFGGWTDASTTAWTHVKRTVHQYALEEGLPEIPGYYGIDTATGEFLKTE